MPSAMQNLEARKNDIVMEIARLGDMRAGSISQNFRRCGKPGCHCSRPDDPGHGPYYAYTWKEQGKTHTRNLRPGQELDRLRNQVEHYRSFRGLCRELVDVSEQICDLRGCEDDPGQWMKKKRLTSSARRSPGR